LEFHWNITYWHMLPGHFNKYTPGIYCILLEFQHITGLISRGRYSEVGLYSSHFISLLHDRTMMSTPFTAFILCTPSTHCMCWHCHIGFTDTKRIYMVHISP